MRNFKEYIIHAEPFLPELLSGAFWQLDISGVVEENNYLKVFTPSDASVTTENLKEVLNSLKAQQVINDYTIDENEFEDRNWNEEWERSINVIEVSDRIVIKPSFKEYTPKEGQLILTIDPKMSFGTGEHQTTRLIIRFLEKYVKPGMRVLDAGTGTGILAIAAVKLGADSAVAFDNDEWCYDNGIENTAQNGVSDKVDIRLAETKDIPERDFDLVVANINRHILLEVGHDLKERLKSKGTLILSGLLFSDEQDIVKYYTGLGLTLIEKQQMDEWISLVMQSVD